MSLIWVAGVIGVLSIPRTDFFPLWGFYSIAFGAYALLAIGNQHISLVHGLMLAFFCRLLTFFFDPMLSDDYFRFIWDGMVMHNGLNPAAITPATLIGQQCTEAELSLYSLLNSKTYFTVYPPATQLIFYLSYAMNGMDAGGHIVFFKILLLLADAAIVFMLAVLLKKNNQPIHRILIYALNPLVIIEYCGNLHMEGFMIAGLLAAIIFAEKRRWWLGTFFMSFSICIKMTSAISMPFMPREKYWKRILLWCSLTAAITGVTFWMFFGSHSGWVQSVALWFRSFEFNASLYYIARAIHAVWKGYDHIQLLGPVMALMTLVAIVITWIFYMRNKHLHWSSVMVIVYTIYFLMGTTIHPWYLGTLLTISIISGHRYPLIWTYLVFLSYSHYANGGFNENYIFISLEYSLLLLWMIMEFRIVHVGRFARRLSTALSPVAER